MFNYFLDPMELSLKEARNQVVSDWELVAPNLRIFSSLPVELSGSTDRKEEKAKKNNAQDFTLN